MIARGRSLFKIRHQIIHPALHIAVSMLIYSGTVDVNALDNISGLRESVEIYLNLEEYVPDLYNNYRNIPDFELKAAETICNICTEHGIHVVNMNQILVTKRFCERLVQKGLGVSAWTVDWSEEMQWFFANRVHNLTTRRPKNALTARSTADQG